MWPWVKLLLGSILGEGRLKTRVFFQVPPTVNPDSVEACGSQREQVQHDDFGNKRGSTYYLIICVKGDRIDQNSDPELRLPGYNVRF